MSIGSPSRSPGRLYAALLLLAAAGPLYFLLRWIVAAIPFPYALDYNEGIVWKQMNDMVAGRAYGPLGDFPAIVYHYPPVYHLLSAGVASLGIDPLSSGRIVSLLSTLGSAVIVALLTGRMAPVSAPRLTRAIGMGAAVFCFLGCEGVQFWAPLMRVDPAACFFALLGLWLIILAVERPALIYAAALAFVLSVFSKQNSVITAAAGLGALLFYRPALALRGIAACLVMGGLFLATLIWMTDGEVLRHLILYNINRFDLSRLLPNLFDGTEETDRLLLLLGISGVIWTLVARRGAQAGNTAAALVARRAVMFFLLLSTLSLVTTAKYGSSSAYYMQWEAALAIFGGLAVVYLVEAAGRFQLRGHKILAALCLALPLGIGIWTAAITGPRHLRDVWRLQQEDDELAALIRPIKGPILSSEMALLLRTGHDVLWEPAIFRELSHAGLWKEDVLVAKIRHHEIKAVISDGDRGYRWFDEQFSPAIADAMDEALPRKVEVGIRVLHLPAKAPR
ncbi:MAG TPA: hypothetical protein VF503_01725 [Sphingobium sp.]|uniref:ArnT family glycosyltransferase n=1 Tax=Sphingobium sp. TaxID=1912891 RepID=UPI002ED1C5CF